MLRSREREELFDHLQQIGTTIPGTVPSEKRVSREDGAALIRDLRSFLRGPGIRDCTLDYSHASD
jgi:hypothetical protein